MSIKIFTIAVCLFLFQIFHAQNSVLHKFGEPMSEEFGMNNYNLEPEAPGVILYERGSYSVDEVDGYIRLIKNVHQKIKVFDAKNFKHASVEIPYYRENNIRENVTHLKAITHNGKAKEFVAEKAIFDTDETSNWSQKKFTFPNVQDGSILEYTYQIETPYFTNLGSWSFMNDLPTVYSELHTEIPGNFNYNRTLYGSRKLDVNHAEIKKACFHLEGFKVPGDCESATYAMKNIPSKSEEKYMLSPSNYVPALKFELVQIIDLNESRTNFARTWKDVDNKFKNDKDLGRQLKYTDFFKEKLPASILSISDDLERSKKVFYFIQEHYNWNGQLRGASDVQVKEAFDLGVGNSFEINLSLINALEAAGLDAMKMLIATRDRAIPSKQYPVVTDFNYAMVFMNIKDEKYILDATDKNTPFGILPFRNLNVEGRVLDFKEGSYWEPIQPFAKNMHYVNMQLTANDLGRFEGIINEVSTGYISVEKRKENTGFSTEEHIKRKQSINEGLDILDLKTENAKDLEQPFKESYNITLHKQAVADRIFLYPFLMQPYFNENPFQKDSRNYPIDFGFPIINNYLISIDVKDQYEIIQVPENKMMRLPENDGELSVVYDRAGSKINIRLSLRLNNTSFAPEAYMSLQQFFGTLIKIKKEEPIELKRIQ